MFARFYYRSIQKVHTDYLYNQYLMFVNNQWKTDERNVEQN